MSFIQKVLPLPRHHGEPCPRLLARAAALKGDAAEVAYRIQCIPNGARRGLMADLVAEHQALILRSHAATLLAFGHDVLAREYIRSARRLEVVA